jgi:hypothetical protein
MEQIERLQDRVNFNVRATIELAQRGSVLDRSGIRNPRCQDRPLLFRRQLRIVRNFASG